jgi:hypothetical protein
MHHASLGAQAALQRRLSDARAVDARFGLHTDFAEGSASLTERQFLPQLLLKLSARQRGQLLNVALEDSMRWGLAHVFQEALGGAADEPLRIRLGAPNEPDTGLALTDLIQVRKILLRLSAAQRNDVFSALRPCQRAPLEALFNTLASAGPVVVPPPMQMAVNIQYASAALSLPVTEQAPADMVPITPNEITPSCTADDAIDPQHLAFVQNSTLQNLCVVLSQLDMMCGHQGCTYALPVEPNSAQAQTVYSFLQNTSPAKRERFEILVRREYATRMAAAFSRPPQLGPSQGPG